MNDASHNTNNDSRLAMPPDEMFDLMADRAAFGLDDADAKQLDEMLGHHAWVREDCLDEVAAGELSGRCCHWSCSCGRPGWWARWPVSRRARCQPRFFRLDFPDVFAGCASGTTAGGRVSLSRYCWPI